MTEEDNGAKKAAIIPPKIKTMLGTADSWFFNIFEFNDESKNEPLRWITHYFFKHYDLIQKFNINPIVLNNFITTVEAGYKKYNNPYHNNIHAADVTQTMNAILCETNLIEWLTDLEIFACLLAAIIHDYEHDGKTNDFLIATDSDRALIYNDRTVHENHHLSATFSLLQNDEYNILKNLSQNEYNEISAFLVDLVLSTDMAFHIQILKEVKTRLNLPEVNMPKIKALALVLHASNISNSFKKYPLNLKWADVLSQELFAQGDLERELGLPISPLCDRHSTSIPKSRLNFLEFVVKPTFDMTVEVVHFTLRERKGHINKSIRTPWVECCAENIEKWNEENPPAAIPV